MYMRVTDMEAQEVIHESWMPDGYKTSNPIEQESITLQHRLGNVELTRLWFEGIHMHHGSFEVHQDFNVKIECDTPVLEMHFSLTGHTSGIVHEKKELFEFGNRQHNIIYTPPIDGIFGMRAQKERTNMFEVQLSENYFRRLVSPDSRVMNHMLERIELGQITSMASQNQHLTGQMDLLIQEMMHCNKAGVLKRLFIESKVLELFMLQMEQFEQVSARPLSLKASDVEKLQAVKSIIEQNIATPYSLMELAQMVGLNDFKLKKGFRELFGITVFGYLHDLRMEQAKVLLLDHQKHINEISDEIGYKNPHHFTVAFKKKYGVLPSKLRD